jgi:hypothetical protein
MYSGMMRKNKRRRSSSRRTEEGEEEKEDEEKEEEDQRGGGGGGGEGLSALPLFRRDPTSRPVLVSWKVSCAVNPFRVVT